MFYNMNAKSQTHHKISPPYEVNINFDEASEHWKANKRHLGNGCYRYVCYIKGKNNNTCIARCLPGKNYCETHLRMLKEGLL